MTHIVPFSFEGQSVRAVVIDGEPGFVGKDVAGKLGFSDPTNAMKQHCRGVVKYHPIPDALGRAQETRILFVPDVLRLIAGSTLPDAERMERWMFEEVLPSVIKTGSYSVAQRGQSERTPRVDVAREHRLAMAHNLRIAKMIGLEGNQAALSANRATIAMTGFDTLGLMGITHINAPQNDVLLTPTEIGERIGGVTAQKINQALIDMGLQERFPKLKGGYHYVPTEDGRAAGGVMQDTGKNHDDGTPVRQLKWTSAIAPLVGDWLKGKAA